MKKALTIILIIIAACAALLVSVVALSPLFLNAYREQILEQASKALNREVGLGDIRLTIFSGPGVRLQAVSVANAGGFRSEPMLSMQSLDVKLNLIPLLKKQLQLDRIILNSPRILIEKNIRGDYNFSDLMPDTKRSAPAKQSEKPSGRGSPGGLLAGFAVARVIISDGSLHYYEAGTPQAENGMLIDNLDLELERVTLQDPIAFRCACRAEGIVEEVQLEGTLGPLGPAPDIMTAAFAARLSVSGLDLSQAMRLVPDGALEIEDGLLSGGADVAGDLATGLRVSGNARVKSLTIRDPDDDEIMISGMNLTLEEELTVTLRQQKIRVTNITIAGKQNRVTLAGEIRRITDAAELALTLSSTDISLLGLDQYFPAFSGIRLDGTARVQGTITGRPAERIRITMDWISPQLAVQVTGDAAGLEAQRKAPVFPIVAEALASAGSTRAGSDLFVPEHIDVQGAFEVARGSINAIPFTDLRGKYTVSPREITVTDGALKGFGEHGTASGSFRIGLEPQPFTCQCLLTISRVDLEALQGAFVGAQPMLSGECSGSLSLSGTGRAPEDIAQNLQGQGNLTVEKGIVNNINLEKKIFSSLSEKTGLPVQAFAEMGGITILQGDQTPLDELQVRFSVAGGSAVIEDCRMTAQSRGFTARGNIGFDRRIDLRARMLVKKTEQEKQPGMLYLVDDQHRKYIPFHLTGTTAAPQVTVDAEALLKGWAGQALGKQRETLREKLGPEVEKLLEQLMKGR